MRTIKFCERELRIGYTTVVDYSNYLREVCAQHLLATLRIGGSQLTVEIDES